MIMMQLLCGNEEGLKFGALRNRSRFVSPPRLCTRHRPWLKCSGATPVPNAPVRIENIDSTGPQGFFEQNLNTDNSGNYSLSNVPVGTIRISSTDGNGNPQIGATLGASAPTGPLTGFSSGRITAGQTSTVNVVLGQGFSFRPGFNNFNLDGTLGFRFDIVCDGTISRAAWDTASSVVREAGILKTDIKYEEIIDMSFVESTRASL